MTLVRHVVIASIRAAVIAGLAVLFFAYPTSGSFAAQVDARINAGDAPSETGLVLAQRPPAKGTQPAAPPAAAPAAPAAPEGPVRTETTNFDVWQVACREIVGSKAKKICAATLVLAMVENNQRQVLGAWVIGRNNEGVLHTALQTPIFRTPKSGAGILISQRGRVETGHRRGAKG